MTIYLNDFGLQVWRHKTNKDLFISTPYSWVDCYSMVDESEGRQVVATFSSVAFKELEHAFTPVTPEEYTKVKRAFKDMYDETDLAAG